MNKKLILSGLAGCLTTVGAFLLGYKLSKKRYSPIKLQGEMFIDYSENKDKPSIYLNILDQKIFATDTEFIILDIVRIRK